MRWLNRGIWKAVLTLIGLLLFLIFMVWVPASSVRASKRTLGLAVARPMQATPTVDVTGTITALNEEKLKQEIQQLKNQNGNQNNWLVNNSTALIAAVATVMLALFGILQWAITVRQSQNKDLRDRAEERFQAAVTALGNEKESVQVGGAILLRSFLNPDDKEIYGRYYTQIFDLAVAYMRLSSPSQPSDDPDGLPPPPEDPNAALPLTTLRQALTSIFRQVFPLAQRQNTGVRHSLDASRVQLDNGYFVRANLRQAWMPGSSLRKINLNRANLTGATLREADLTKADLTRAILSGANLSKANFTEAELYGADLTEANLRKANLRRASLNRTTRLTYSSRARSPKLIFRVGDIQATNLTGADLEGADLNGANLEGVNLEATLSLKDTNLCGVNGLTKEQLEACKAKGAIVDEVTATSPLQSPAIPSAPSLSSNDPTPSASPVQVNTPSPSADGSSSTSSRSGVEP